MRTRRQLLLRHPGDKSWVNDPAGVRWETFHTFGEAVTYGEDSAVLAPGRAPPPGVMLRRRRSAPGPSVQRTVPLHRQFGAIDHGRSDPQPGRPGTL